MNNILVILVLIKILLINQILSMQSNNTCAQLPKDKRQLVCICGKQLQLRCTFNIDIKEIDPVDMDKTLRPIYMNEVTIERKIDPSDPYDVNLDLIDKQKLEENNVYLYFPNFNVFNSPYIRITFNRFMYVPSFAFSDYKSLLAYEHDTFKHIASIVFELADVNDFGIDKFAFYGLQSESLVIEGPFNQLTIHTDSFRNSRIDELVIGCYCLECETFSGDCSVMFGQKSVRNQQTIIDSKLISNKSAMFKRLKMYGIQLNPDWSMDDLPNVNELTYLEISNLISSNNNLIEFKSLWQQLNNLKQLHLRNNGIQKLNRQLFQLFPQLSELNLAQNNIELIDMDTFFDIVSLTHLNLERNKLRRINRLILNSLSNLKVLNLKENLLESLDDFSFKQMKYLQHLDLTRNRLTHLNQNTFDGMQNLKELLLSYNPFKRIDSSTFKFLQTQNTNLIRLDLISNTESDWFVFDDQDICLLTSFKCQTEINIDTDQRCNCFVKYLNEINNSVNNGRQTRSEIASFKNKETDTLNNDDDDLFQPCSTNELDEQDLINDVQSRIANNRVEYMSCSKNLLRKCYSSELGRLLQTDGTDDHLFNQSCLYNKFIANNIENQQQQQSTNSDIILNTKQQQQQQLTSSIGLFSSSENNNNNNDDEYKTTQSDLFDLKKEASFSQLYTSIITQTTTSTISPNNENINKYGFKSLIKMVSNSNKLEQQTTIKNTVEKNLFYLLVGLLIVFIISICSLLISVYLLIKRNTFIYQTAGSSYPIDER
jgi:Leucine-rich repeat (LRR) protein